MLLENEELVLENEELVLENEELRNYIINDIERELKEIDLAIAKLQKRKELLEIKSAIFKSK
jgi:regulator of replication initiation timing